MEENVNSIGKSRFTLGILGGFLVGIFFADKIPLGFSWAIGIVIGLVIAIVLLWQDKMILLGLSSLLAFSFGLIYYHFWDFRENNKRLIYNSECCLLKGKIDSTPIISKPEITNTQKFVIKYQNTKILIQTGKYPEYRYGDIVKVSGTLEKPYPENYYFKKGIRGEIKNPDINVVGRGGNPIVKNIYKVGDAFEESLNKILAEPYAALQAGIITGVKRNIPDSLMSAFNRTGLTHIVAVSGYNLMIIVSALSYLILFFGREISFGLSIIGIIFFVILTGAPASVIRAAILAVLVLYCKLLGRRPYYPILIMLVAAIMLLFNPYALKNDISFQLSFLAFIGLVWLSSKIEQIKLVKILPDFIKKAFSETMGAQIMVLPILLFNFGILSIVAPLANILVLPIIQYAMLWGFFAGVGGIIFLELGKLLGMLAWILLKYIIVVTVALSSLPAAAATIKTASWWWMPIYFLIIFIIFNNRKGKIEKEY